MTITYGFDYELPSGQACYVEAEIEPLVPAHTNCAPEDAYPAEGGGAEVTSVTIGGTEIDLANVWVAKPQRDLSTPRQFGCYLDDLAATAYDKWEDEQ
jgi:hypothetical protein